MNKIKKFNVGVAIFAILVLFYNAGQYEAGRISTLSFLVRFAADMICFVLNVCWAGGFSAEKE